MPKTETLLNIDPESKRVTVVGAGFSGLVTAFYLVRLGFRVQIIEASGRAGGLIQTHDDSFGLVETAANGLLNSKLVEELFSVLGVPILSTLASSRKRYIFRDGRPRRWPFGWASALKLILFILKTALDKRAVAPKPFETIRSWGLRVLGADLTRFGLEAALQGVYAGDPNRLSATVILGKHFGLRDPTKVSKPKVRGTISAPRGMGQLIDALEAYLSEHDVSFVYNKRFSFSDSDAFNVLAPSTPHVIATSSTAAAHILERLDPDRAAACRRVEVLPLASATVSYREASRDVQGFGCLFPPASEKPVLGVLMNTFIFPNRSREGYSETWIFGGALPKSSVLLDSSDEEVLNTIDRQRGQCFTSVSEKLGWRITRWSAALPHYTIDLEKDLPLINQQRQNVFLIGNYTGDIGLSSLLARAERLARQILEEGEWT